MFERYTERARQVIVITQNEARSFNHSHIGTEHLLLGLLGEEEGLAARTLKAAGITSEAVRGLVTTIVGRCEGEPPPQQIPFTPRAKKVLEGSLREALSLGHNYVGTEHILLGLLRESEGVAARILLSQCAGPEKIRDEVMRKLYGSQSPKPSAAPPKPVAAVAQGWECPRCRTINAPFTASCRCAA